MKNILFTISFLFSFALFGQNCYTVKSVENKTENPDLSSKRFTFGVKQIAEELIGEKVSNFFVVVLVTPSQFLSVFQLSIQLSDPSHLCHPFMYKMSVGLKTFDLIDHTKN